MKLIYCKTCIYDPVRADTWQPPAPTNVTYFYIHADVRGRDSIDLADESRVVQAKLCVRSRFR